MSVRLSIHWPAVIFITAMLYVGILVFIPFNQTWSTLCLFAIIAFWSRIPGVGMHSPMLILYFMDVIDFFSVIISINIGGMAGGLFSLSMNLGSRFCGGYPEWISTIKDSFAQFISCLILPLFLPYIGYNIEAGIIIYTIARTIVYMIFRVIPDGQDPISFWIQDIIGMTIIIFLINIIYARLFGQFFNAILQHGVSFNWWLFLGVTAILYIVKTKLFGKTRHPFVIRIAKNIIRKIRAKQAQKQKRENRLNEITDRLIVKRTIKDLELENSFNLN